MKPKHVFKPDPETYNFNDTSFNLLMQKRIRRVLLICSSYDAFMLEEDGRIDEQIFNEYVSLNLRYPPSFIHTDSALEAMLILESETIDLVIEMLSIRDIDTFQLAHQIKTKHPAIPIVVLTHFSREVSIKLKNEDLTAIDHVFCWLGNADLLLAIIKLIEDRMNAEFDIQKVGVQSIILVEDSIRFTSTYLPNLYKIIFKQSQGFVREALNEHQRMLRMRGRPKILLATTYDEATALYDRFGANVLGIISDISFRMNPGSEAKTQAGIELCKKIRTEDPHLPFVFQSSDLENERVAQELNVGFIHKYNKTLNINLRNYIIRHFGFGDFVFRDPATQEEIARASDLQSLQQQILKIPDLSLEYHTSRNDLSKWLRARALFPIANMFKQLQLEDFENTNEIRHYIFEAISSYRMSKSRGVIAKFDKSNYDQYLLFSRIGDGSIGGKARGLAFINALIKKHQILHKYPGVILSIPRTVVISTEVFDEFMETNDLYKVGLSNLPDEEILRRFVEAKLPGRIHQDLYAFVAVLSNPVAVRSSSKLEDSHYQPFAGIYSTYMIPHVKEDSTLMIKMLTDAIKSVYASVYYKNSKAYMTATSNVIDEEKMGIVLQEVCGNQYGERFYPTLSGVARSINFYPIAPEKPMDGIANIGFGLGKYVVDGGMTIRFSPKYPRKILQLSNPEMALKETQKIFYSLDLSPRSWKMSTDDGVNLMKQRISEADKDQTLKYVASTYDLENHMIRDGVLYQGKRIITFSNILNHNSFPLAEILNDLLELGQREMNNPIEIEFAVNLDRPNGSPKIFNFLQIRPIVINDQRVTFRLDKVNLEHALIYSTSALGNGIIDNLHDIVYVKPGNFNSSETKNIASMVEMINTRLMEEKRNYVLVGPGRWGSSDPWLGIPVKWPQISEARVIVESGLDHYQIDPSQGTHFFQNLTSFRVGYFTINPFKGEGHYDSAYLDTLPALHEDKYIRHVRLDQPMKVMIDGRHNKGVIFKPGC